MIGESMTWLQTIVLGIVQGLTEFLPISSSGHLRIVSEIFFGEDAGASFTAVTQLGTEAAVLVFFAGDIWRILRAWFRGLFHKEHRSDHDYKMGWYVILGTIPIASSACCSRTTSAPSPAICGSSPPCSSCFRSSSQLPSTSANSGAT